MALADTTATPSALRHLVTAGGRLPFLAELKHRLEEQLDANSGVSSEMSPHQLTIYYCGESIGSWQGTEEGARWQGTDEQNGSPSVIRDVYDALQVTKRALFVFVRDVKGRAP